MQTLDTCITGWRPAELPDITRPWRHGGREETLRKGLEEFNTAERTHPLKQLYKEWAECPDVLGKPEEATGLKRIKTLTDNISALFRAERHLFAQKEIAATVPTRDL